MPRVRRSWRRSRLAEQELTLELDPAPPGEQARRGDPWRPAAPRRHRGLRLRRRRLEDRAAAFAGAGGSGPLSARTTAASGRTRTGRCPTRCPPRCPRSSRCWRCDTPRGARTARAGARGRSGRACRSLRPTGMRAADRVRSRSSPHQVAVADRVGVTPAATPWGVSSGEILKRLGWGHHGDGFATQIESSRAASSHAPHPRWPGMVAYSPSRRSIRRRP